MWLWRLFCDEINAPRLAQILFRTTFGFIFLKVLEILNFPFSSNIVYKFVLVEGHEMTQIVMMMMIKKERKSVTRL